MTRGLQRLYLYSKLIRLDRPIGILLLLWPTLWGLWFAAKGIPPLSILAIFVTGTILMRSAGCAVNDYADREFDKYVTRTRQRPVTSGQIAPFEALMVASVLTFVAGLLLFFLPKQVWLWAIAAVFFAVSYPFTKRFFSIPQVYLGIAFGLGIPMAYVVIQGSVPSIAWLLVIANIFWALAYDTEYAMVDREDDRKLGIRTAALTFGKLDVVMIMLSYMIALSILGVIGWQMQMRKIYFSALVVAALIMIYHFTLIRKREPTQCFQAFLHNNWFGGVIFLGIALDYGVF